MSTSKSRAAVPRPSSDVAVRPRADVAWSALKPKTFCIRPKPVQLRSRGGAIADVDTREPVVDFPTGNTVANAGMYDYALTLVEACPFPSRESRAVGQFLACHQWPKLSFERPHAHAQVPPHRSPSVERFRIHFEGMVRSPGWVDGFPEVGCRRGPWHRRWAKDLLDASTEDQNNPLRRCAACQRLYRSRNRAATQSSL
jgi:hypothetical protein